MTPLSSGSHVQIGKFGPGGELEYQDILEGSLLTTADKVIDLIYLKYLKAKVSFEHDRRTETYPFARDAIREAVYNAIAHNCYMFGAPIQIRIEDEAMIISNRCILPEGWTVDTLMEPHDSVPYNPDIANVFYRAGYIERWGRGIETICDACRELGAEMPVYELRGNGLRVRFAALQSALVDNIQKGQHDTDRVPENVTKDVPKLTEKEKRILALIADDRTITTYRMALMLGISRKTVQRTVDKLKNYTAKKESIINMEDDLQRMELTPGQFYNFHPGSHVGQGIPIGIEKIIDVLNASLFPEMTTTVLLETMAGKGSEVGGRFEELRAILDGVAHTEKVGVCLDTCHVWDAGYDIVGDLDGVLTEFDRVVGLNRLHAVHLNNSKNPLGSHKDRHARLVDGVMPLDAITRIINHPALRALPFILETPNEDEGYAEEIQLLRTLRR